MAVRRKKIREIVEGILAQHEIVSGPINIENIIRAYPIKVRKDEVDDELSGFLLRNTEKNEVILGVNKNHHANRVRFTMAHELGHYLLHEGEKVHLDSGQTAYKINNRDEKASMGEDEIEKEANHFAAELLMPAKFIYADLDGIKLDLLDDSSSELLDRLASKYQVSQQAITFRLANLGYITL